MPLLLRELDCLVEGGVLYKRTTGGQTTHQFVLPEQFQRDVMKSLHDDFGHVGIDHTLDLVRRRFYWLKMVADIAAKAKTCCV